MDPAPHHHPSSCSPIIWETVAGKDPDRETGTRKIKEINRTRWPEARGEDASQRCNPGRWGPSASWSNCVHAQSCPTPCNLMNCSPPGSSIQGIIRARTLEWAAASSSRGSSPLRDQTHISSVSCSGRRVLLLLSHLGNKRFLIHRYLFLSRGGAQNIAFSCGGDLVMWWCSDVQSVHILLQPSPSTNPEQFQPLKEKPCAHQCSLPCPPLPAPGTH